MRLAIGLLFIIGGLWLGVTVAQSIWMGAAQQIIDGINAGRLDAHAIGDGSFHLILSLLAGYIIIGTANVIGGLIISGGE